MEENRADVTEQFGLEGMGQFQPHARYHHGMDMLVYMAEDCSYRAERVDPFLTLFLHPYEDRPVGVKMKGFRHVFLRVKDSLNWTEGDWLHLVPLLEAAMTKLGPEVIQSESEKRARSAKYEQARLLVRQVALEPREVAEILRAA